MIKLINILKEIIEGTCGYTTDANTNKKLNTPGGLKESDPKVGTGKKPKGSSRRLYTDEDPTDTVSIKFKTAQDIKDTLSKTSFKSKSHARQSQIINLIHQRVRAAYGKAKDPEVKARLKKGLEKFISYADTEVNYFDENSDISKGTDYHKFMKNFSKEYEELKKLMPTDTIKKDA